MRKLDVRINGTPAESSGWDIDPSHDEAVITCPGPTKVRRGDVIDAHLITISDTGKQAVLPIVEGATVSHIDADVSDGAINESRIHFDTEAA